MTMRFYYLTVAIAVVALSLAFQSSPSTIVPDPTVAADTSKAARIGLGAELFSRICQRCHYPRGPAERTDREWVIVMQHMQTRANLTRKQVALMREFLLASNDTDSAPGRLRSDLQPIGEITDDTIAQGKLVYNGAGTCFACHGERLQGGPIAPNLKDDRWKVGTGDFESILTIVRNGVAGTAMAAYPGGISDEQAQQVAAFVWAAANE